MADTKISALTGAGSAAAANEYAINEAGTSKKVTGTQIKTFVNNAPVFAAGSASAGTWPVFTSGTILTTAEDGAVEVDANCFYATTDASNRGYVPIMNLIRQDANRAVFANNTNQQAIFDAVAGGTLTLETGTYLFEALVQVSVTSATSGNLKFSLLGGGGATLGTILYIMNAIDAANDTNTAPTMTSEIVSTQVATNMATATVATVTTFWARGTFEVTVAGSIIPSVAQTTGTGSQVTTAGSFFHCNRIGSTTATSVGQWT